MSIIQRHEDQIRDAFENGEYHDIVHKDFGRRSPINTVVWLCTDEDGAMTYYAADIESALFDYGEDDICFEDFCEDLVEVERKEVKSFVWSPV